jgi:uncharacterized protein with WD repeat
MILLQWNVGIEQINLTTGNTVHVAETRSTDVAFSPHKRWIFLPHLPDTSTAPPDHQPVDIYQTHPLERIATVHIDMHSFHPVTWSPDGRYLAGRQQADTFAIWQLNQP